MTLHIQEVQENDSMVMRKRRKKEREEVATRRDGGKGSEEEDLREDEEKTLKNIQRESRSGIRTRWKEKRGKTIRKTETDHIKERYVRRKETK